MAIKEKVKNKKFRNKSKKAKVVKVKKVVEKKENVFADILSESIEDDSSYKMLINKHPILLTPEQIIFCLEYVNCGYITSVAVRNTFGAEDWSDSKVLNVGKKLLKLQKIRDQVQHELDNRCEKLRVSADWAARKYKAWSQINVTDYIEVHYPRQIGAGRNIKPRPQIRLKTKLEDMPKEIRGAIKKVSVGAQGDLNVEFIDQKAALDSLVKLLGFTENKLVLDNRVPINIFFDDQDDEA